MKLILFFAISCLALHNGRGAPRTAVYNFVRCNPDGDQANCVTLQTPEMAWSPDLPAKLPASTAQYLEAEPVEGESPVMEEDKEDEEEEVEYYDTPIKSEDGESPDFNQHDEGSGEFEFEGSAAMADIAAPEGETGSGQSWTEKDREARKGENKSGMRRLFPSISLANKGKPAEQELREDHLLQLH